MAKNGTIKGTTYIQGHYWLELDWSDIVVDTTHSSCTVKTYFVSDWAANFTASKNGSTTVNGSALSWTSSADVNHGNSLERTLVHSRSGVNVTHNADGTKSITISATYTPNITITGYGTISTMSASGTAVLSDTLTEIIPLMYIWNGTAWVRAKHFKVWDGSDWGDCNYIRIWNGTSWVVTK